MKRVYGSYSTSVQAAAIVEELLKQGYTKRQIKVISNKNLGHEFRNVETVEAHDGGKHSDDDRSMWQKIKDTFTFDEYDDNYWDNNDLDSTESNLLKEYKTNLDNDEIVVLVEGQAGGTGSFKGNRNVNTRESILDGSKTRDTKLSTDSNRNLTEDERVIKLKKEELDINKDRVKTGEVDIKKVVKEETKTIEVPVEKEELVIERRPGSGSVAPGDTIEKSGVFEKDDEIHIPLTEERVEVNKRTVSDGEVVVKKEKHTENKTIKENVKSEDIKVEGDGKVKGDVKRDLNK